MTNSPVTRPSVLFADVAHQYLIFDPADEACRLVLELIDTPWVQRLRSIRQTGNTNLVYMFAEHSRFGHSLGVAYLALALMDKLSRYTPELVRPYRNAVAAAALLHDVGHVAPGSHIAEKVWTRHAALNHEHVSLRIVQEDPVIQKILIEAGGLKLVSDIVAILQESTAVPAWASTIISGGGWNADRGNWAIVDSAMCSVQYGRYNVLALLDAFRIVPDGRLVLAESRLDALTHFFVARDSMYRQVYQHRVLQAVDALTKNIAIRLRDILLEAQCDNHPEQISTVLAERNIFADETMRAALCSNDYTKDVPLSIVFNMTEQWWRYHIDRWCECGDLILKDLSLRLRDRKLFKTIRLEGAVDSNSAIALRQQVETAAEKLGFDPRYYVTIVDSSDRHRRTDDTEPLILKDSGDVVPVTAVEPVIAQFVRQTDQQRRWIATPREVKEHVLGSKK